MSKSHLASAWLLAPAAAAAPAMVAGAPGSAPTRGAARGLHALAMLAVLALPAESPALAPGAAQADAGSTDAPKAASVVADTAGVDSAPPHPAALDRAAVARAEYDAVMVLTPNIDNGRRAYQTCAVCHLPEAWGSTDGTYPQIAGQLRTVIIKQLADYRAGNRENPLMYPFSVPGILGGLQQLADVAAYVAQLPKTPHNGVGPGTDPELGEQLYEENCVDCHGPAGEGDLEKHIPAVAGQHYAYLLRQFEDIRTGKRRNADPKMVEQIQDFTRAEEEAVLDYTARLRPPAKQLAPEGWRNPDFPAYARDAAGIRATPPAPPE